MELTTLAPQIIRKMIAILPEFLRIAAFSIEAFSSRTKETSVPKKHR